MKYFPINSLNVIEFERTMIDNNYINIQSKQLKDLGQ